MIVWLLLVLIVAVGIFGLISRAGSRISERDRARARASWQSIAELMTSEDDHAWTKAIFEADKLLEWSMGVSGVSGKGLGEKLRNGRRLIRNIDDIWNAHKLRNKLAHEMNVQIRKQEAVMAIKSFEIAIRNLGLI